MGVRIAAPSCRSQVGSLVELDTPSRSTRKPPRFLLWRRSVLYVLLPCRVALLLAVPFLSPPRRLCRCIPPHFVGRLYHSGYSPRLVVCSVSLGSVGLADCRGSLHQLPSLSFTKTAFGVWVDHSCGFRCSNLCASRAVSCFMASRTPCTCSPRSLTVPCVSIRPSSI